MNVSPCTGTCRNGDLMAVNPVNVTGNYFDWSFSNALVLYRIDIFLLQTCGFNPMGIQFRFLNGLHWPQYTELALYSLQNVY